MSFRQQLLHKCKEKDLLLPLINSFLPLFIPSTYPPTSLRWLLLPLWPQGRASLLKAEFPALKHGGVVWPPARPWAVGNRAALMHFGVLSWAPAPSAFGSSRQLCAPCWGGQGHPEQGGPRPWGWAPEQVSGCDPPAHTAVGRLWHGAGAWPL